MGEAVVVGTDVAWLSLLDVSTAVVETAAPVSVGEVLEIVAVEAVDRAVVGAAVVPGEEEAGSRVVLRVTAEVAAGRDVAPVAEVDVSLRMVVGVVKVSGGVLLSRAVEDVPAVLQVTSVVVPRAGLEFSDLVERPVLFA